MLSNKGIIIKIIGTSLSPNRGTIIITIGASILSNRDKIIIKYKYHHHNQKMVQTLHESLYNFYIRNIYEQHVLTRWHCHSRGRNPWWGHSWGWHTEVHTRGWVGRNGTLVFPVRYFYRTDQVKTCNTVYYMHCLLQL